MTETIQLKQADRMMTQVCIDAERRVLEVRFADGMHGEIPAEDIERGKPPVKLDLDRVELPGPYVILIGVEGRFEPEEIPWDFARHYCDAGYEAHVRQRAREERVLVGQRIKQLRARKGLTQSELAKAAGIGRTTLSRLENGDEQSPRFNTLQHIAEALRLDLSEMLLNRPQA